MTSKKKTTYTPNDALVPAPTAGEADPNKLYPPLDVRSTFSNPSYQYPTTALVTVPSNTPIPDATNTPVDLTEVFTNMFSNITEALLFLFPPISYEPRTVLIRL